jgi:fibro-slime domain-containing protein
VRRRLTIAAGLALVAGCGGSSGLKHGDAGADAGAAPEDAGITDLPPIPTDGYLTTRDGVGGYQLGPRLAPSVMTIPSTSSTGCHTLQGIVRDFRGALPAWGGALQPGGHPDFEVFEGRGITSGLVAPLLGPDRKPVYASQCELGALVTSICPYGAMTTSKENFDQWYRSVDGVNITYVVYFALGSQRNTPKFASYDFFPLDGKGWGNSGTDINFKVQHNYSFTTEIHTTFRYNGGETFTFQGDDDVWIFINGKLAVDLGGLHFSTSGSVDLDVSAATLGIQKGAVYPLDLFNAERHSVNSDFSIELNFAFEDCGYIVP